MTVATPAAQYVRMSTEHQRYSIDNQLAVLGLYAEANAFRLIRTYADEGRSGLNLRGRPGLQRLLTDAADPTRPFEVVLVYDVSRWGRFQDIDESAYYEHLCRRHGLRIIYCAEPFENDQSGLSSIVKALKRVMAAEYSRELSAKTAVGQRSAVLRGHHRGGKPGIGFRRILHDQDGQVVGTLAPGQSKHLRPDYVTLAPGSAEEIALVVRIYEMFVNEGLSEFKIAQRLNAEGLRTPAGSVWRERGVRMILESERNIGTKVHGRLSNRLKTGRTLSPPDTWITIPGAFEAIVPRELFDAAQAIFARRGQRRSDEDLLSDLRAILAREGRLSRSLIVKTLGESAPNAYYTRFGNLRGAYQLIGYPGSRNFAPVMKPPPDIAAMLDHLRGLLRRHGRLNRDLINQADGPKVGAYDRAFGHLGYAYELVGYRARGGRRVDPSPCRKALVEKALGLSGPALPT